MTMNSEIQDPDRIDILSWLGVLRRQKHLVLGSIAVILAATIAWTLTVTPKYTARATLRIEPEASVLEESNLQLGNATSMSALVDGEVEVLRSDTLILQLIQREDLLLDPEFGIQPSRMDKIRVLAGMDPAPLPSGQEALDIVRLGVKGALGVRRLGLTHMIEIGFTSTDPERAARLSNSLTELYIRSQVDAKIDRALLSRDIIAQRLEASRSNLAEAESQVDSFISTLAADSIESLGRADLVDLRGKIDTLDLAAEDLETRSAELSRIAEGGRFQDLAATLTDEATQELLRQRADLSTAQEKDPAADVDRISAELARIDRDLEARTRAALEETQGRISETRSEAERARVDLRSGILSSNLPAATFSEVYALQQSAEIARNEYQSLLARMRQLDSLANLQLADARVISEAIAPHVASFPNLKATLAAGFGAALILGMALAFLREYRIGGYTSPDQVAAALKTTEAVSIPRVSNGARKVADLIVDEPLGTYAESHRRLRFAAQRALRGAPEGLGRVIAVTSSGPNEGKTTLAASMARSFAVTGMKTILVDLDLRNPSVADALGMPGNDTLMTFLVERGDPTGFGKRDAGHEGGNLDIIVGGARTKVPTDTLLTSKTFLDLIETLRKSYEMIVLDTPPVLPVIDPLLVVRHADLVVMPIRFAHTGQPAVREAVRRIRSELPEAAHILPVLSMEKGGTGGYYDGYYGAYGKG